MRGISLPFCSALPLIFCSRFPLLDTHRASESDSSPFASIFKVGSPATRQHAFTLGIASEWFIQAILFSIWHLVVLFPLCLSATSIGLLWHPVPAEGFSFRGKVCNRTRCPFICMKSAVGATRFSRMTQLTVSGAYRQQPLRPLHRFTFVHLSDFRLALFQV